MLPLDHTAALEKIMGDEPRWRVTLFLKTDGDTESSYSRVVRTASPLAALGETLHYFAGDTRKPRDLIFRYEAEIVEGA